MLAADAYAAVLFDLDGTLVDSMAMWGKIDVDYLARYGIPCPPDLQRKLQGLRWTETARYFQDRFGIQKSIEEIGQDWLDMAEEEYRTNTPLMPGVREFLAYLAGKKIPCAICSSNHEDLILTALAAHGLENRFDAVITCEDVSAAKPDPAVYLEGAKRLNADPSACLVFEDIPEGIRAGKAAGMTVCAVADPRGGGQTKEARALADAFISDYRELLP